jgi:hypothetical protein
MSDRLYDGAHRLGVEIPNRASFQIKVRRLNRKNILALGYAVHSKPKLAGLEWYTVWQGLA